MFPIDKIAKICILGTEYKFLIYIIMKRFFKENWDRCISLLLIAASVAIYFCNVPESEIKRILFMAMMVVSIVAVFLRKGMLQKVFVVIIPLLACLSMSSVGVFWMVVIDGITVLLFLIVLFWRCIGRNNELWLILFSIIMAFWCCLCLTLGYEAYIEKAAKEQQAEEVFLEYVDVKSDDSIYIYAKDKGIFRVSWTIAKDWDYQAGDTVKVIIYDDEVISCTR